MKIQKEFLIFKRLLGRNRAHAAHGLQDSEVGPGAAPARHSGAHRARGDDGTRTQSGYDMNHGKVFTVSTQGAR
jgi:hypothetical protein